MRARPHDNTLKAAMLGMGTTTPTKLQPIVPVHPSTARPPSRQGKRVVTAYVSAEVFLQLRLLAAEQDRTTQALLEEALNDLFRKHNKSAVV